MPTYTYRCPNCEREEDITHSIADCVADWDCPVCWDMPAMHRVIKAATAPQAFFFGPGWASTDHVARPNVGRNPSNQNRFSE